MNAYVDSSVVMRLVLSAPAPLAEWKPIDRYISSALLKVECMRAVHRINALQAPPPDAFATIVERLQAIVSRMELVALNAAVLQRAALPFSQPLRTLDAIHLATAAIWFESEDKGLTFATHDKQLALAARSSGFAVIGV